MCTEDTTTCAGRTGFKCRNSITVTLAICDQNPCPGRQSRPVETQYGRLCKRCNRGESPPPPKISNKQHPLNPVHPLAARSNIQLGEHHLAPQLAANTTFGARQFLGYMPHQHRANQANEELEGEPDDETEDERCDRRLAEVVQQQKKRPGLRPVGAIVPARNVAGAPELPPQRQPREPSLDVVGSSTRHTDDESRAGSATRESSAAPETPQSVGDFADRLAYPHFYPDQPSWFP